MHKKEILGFYSDLREVNNFAGIPSNWALVNPYQLHWEKFQFFINKFYSSNNRRNLIIALNPGRFGCNQTGITMTDEKILKSKLGYPGEVKNPKSEKTAARVYSVIEENFPNLNEFFDKYFMTNVFPFGILDEKGNNVIFNDLIKINSIRNFSLDFVKDSLELFKPDKVFCIGRGSEKFISDNFSSLNPTYLHHPARVFPEDKKEEYRKNIL